MEAIFGTLLHVWGDFLIQKVNLGWFHLNCLINLICSLSDTCNLCTHISLISKVTPAFQSYTGSHILVIQVKTASALCSILQCLCSQLMVKEWYAITNIVIQILYQTKYIFCFFRTLLMKHLTLGLTFDNNVLGPISIYVVSGSDIIKQENFNNPRLQSTYSWVDHIDHHC